MFRLRQILALLELKDRVYAIPCAAIGCALSLHCDAKELHL